MEIARPTPPRTHINALTGLRGVAALLVVGNHYFVWCSPYTVDSVPWYLTLPFATAGFGMTLFFTLSGFVITYNYLGLDWRGSPFRSVGNFLFHRFSRLYPTFLLFVLLALNSSSIAGGTDGNFSKWVVFHLTGVQTWLPLKFEGRLPSNGIFHLSWSISTEFMLYLVFVLLVAGCHRRSYAAWPISAALPPPYPAPILSL